MNLAFAATVWALVDVTVHSDSACMTLLFKVANAWHASFYVTGYVAIWATQLL